MKEFKTQATDAKVVINCAPINQAKRLKNVILQEIKKNPTNIRVLNNAKEIFEKEIDSSGLIDFVKDTLIGIDTSDEFEEAIFECLKYCTYNLHKITLDLFDSPEFPNIRDDYYEIIFACLEENMRPFYRSLRFALKDHTGLTSLARLLNAM